MQILPINNAHDAGKAIVHDYDNDPTYETFVTKNNINNALAQKVPNDKNGRNYIELYGDKGYEISFSLPFTNVVVKNGSKRYMTEVPYNAPEGSIRVDMCPKSDIYHRTPNTYVGTYDMNRAFDVNDLALVDKGFKTKKNIIKAGIGIAAATLIAIFGSLLNTNTTTDRPIAKKETLETFSKTSPQIAHTAQILKKSRI